MGCGVYIASPKIASAQQRRVEGLEVIFANVIKIDEAVRVGGPVVSGNEEARVASVSILRRRRGERR